ncbi:mitochondrial carrier family [Haematococcus lacustris]
MVRKTAAQPTAGSETGGNPWPALIAGPIAGLTSRFLFYPGDTVKAQLQVQGSLGGPLRYTSTRHAVAQILKAEGLAGFYKGFGAVLVGNVPANMAYFGGYELARSKVPGSWGLVGDMCVGAVAQLSGGLLYTPLDVVKERMQVHSLVQGPGAPRTSSWKVLTSLVQREGPLGLVRGYWVTNAVWIPWSMVHISLYEQAKRTAVAAGWAGTVVGIQDVDELSAHAGKAVAHASETLPAWLLATCSCAAAVVATLITHPFDVVKTRLQVLGGTGTRASAWSVAQSALLREGPRAFGAGAVARVVTIAPGSAVSWAIFEPVKSALEHSAGVL